MNEITNDNSNLTNKKRGFSVNLPQNNIIKCGKIDFATKTWYKLWQGDIFMPQSVIAAVKDRIQQHGRGWCFTPKHFLDLDSDTGIRTALSRLQTEKMIRRLSHGLYEYPRENPQLGILPPQVDEIAKAIAEKNGIKIQPAGAYAANLTGLSEQVPGRIVFLTDGPSKKVKIGNLEIQFKTARAKTMHAAGTKVGLLIQALRNIGKSHIDDVILRRAKRFLEGTTREELDSDLKHAPQWIRSTVFSLMENTK